MATVVIYHEVEDGDHWAKAWGSGPDSRHALFAEIGIKTRTFRSRKDPNSAAVVLEVPDMAQLQALLESDQGKKAMAEDGLKIDTVRIMDEFVHALAPPGTGRPGRPRYCGRPLVTGRRPPSPSTGG